MSETTQTTNVTYVLSNSEVERARLDDQHVYLTKHVYDNRLIYNAALKLDPDATILDVGTGSGRWIVDLAKILPSTVTLYGVDISSRMFPTTSAHNVHFLEKSATSLPMEWTSKFDFVSQRLLVGGLTKTAWSQALAEIYRVIKPGSEVQLAELNFANWDCSRAPANAMFKNLIATVAERHSLVLDAALQLPHFLESAGFVDVKFERKSVPVGVMAQDGLDGTASFGGGLRAVKPVVMMYNGLGVVENGAEFDALVLRVEREWDEPECSGIDWEYGIATARKPE